MPVIELSLTKLKQRMKNTRSQTEILEALPYLGLDLEGVEGDDVSVEYSPNRPDFSSEAGIARALAGILGVEVGLPKYHFSQSKFAISVADDQIRRVRPHIFGLYAETYVNEELIKELIAMQEDLHNGLGRRRSTVAIGIHNGAVISRDLSYFGSTDDSFSFVPLGSEKKTSIKEILSGTDQGIQYGRILSQGVYPILQDSEGHILSMPPIINGEHTRLKEGISSLFVDITATDEIAGDAVIAIIASMLNDTGAKVETTRIEYSGSQIITPNMEPLHRNFDLELVNKNLGFNFSLDEAKTYLGRSRIELSDRKTALVPRFRADIIHPVDLSEEIALGYGVGRIEALKVESSASGAFNRKLRKLDECVEILIGLGFTEIWNFSLVSKELASHCGTTLRVENPKSQNYEYLRCDITSSLLSTLSSSTDQEYPQKIFELAPVFTTTGNSQTKGVTGISEPYHCAAMIAGAAVNYTEIRSAIDGFLRIAPTTKDSKIVLQPLSFESQYYLKGRSAELLLSNGNGSGKEENAGIVGEISPSALSTFGIGVPVAGFELDLAKLLSIKE